MADLSIVDFRVHFGGVRAVDGVTLAVASGETLAIVGPNGSGKSTLLNAVSGLVPATGELQVDGRPIPLGRPARIRRAGVLRAFQTPQVFAELTCLENVLLAQADRRWTGLSAALLARPGMLRHERERWRAGLAMLSTVGLVDAADRPAGQLSYGQRRRLEVARCLAGTPSVLLLDEPSAGLNEAETRDLATLLASVRGPGLALVIVDHKVGFLEQLCDRIVVLELGQVIAEGAPGAVWADPRVVAAYLGGPDA